ncbi:MAG: Uroporphyrinogen-III synthase [Pseudomonadota bacterium]
MAQARRVIVTRPQDEAMAWVQGLRAEGVVADALPLLAISPLPDLAPARQQWQACAEGEALQALMFVSANAVRHFPFHAAALAQAGLRAWGTGPGTSAALRAAGWPEARIDQPAPDSPQWDSEALWQQVATVASARAGQGVLIVRGTDERGQLAGRDWLAEQVLAAGLPLWQMAVYQRGPAPLDEAARALAEAALAAGDAWLFSSSEAARHLHAAWPGLDLGRSLALATHPRIAQRLRALGWPRVHEVPATLQAQAQSLKLLA